MSLESDAFQRKRPNIERMKAFGFREEDGGFTYEEELLQRQFRACLCVTREGEVTGTLIDQDAEEEYLPIRQVRQIGGFVGAVREEYRAFLARVGEECFDPVEFIFDQSNRIAAAIGRVYGVAPEFPWARYPGNGTFKCKGNGKWFAALLSVAFGKLENKGNSAKEWDDDTVVEVINLKADAEAIPALAESPGVSRAWHMNKTHWISVILDDTLDDEAVMELIAESHRLVSRGGGSAPARSGAWIIPSNPKLYDVDAGFAASGVIDWHQHNDIRAGDELFIYSAAPNSAILYRCAVVEADLRYEGMFRESKGYRRAMRIRLVERYPKDRYPLSFIKANGGSVVRSARRMPGQLLEAILRDSEERKLRGSGQPRTESHRGGVRRHKPDDGEGTK